MKINISNAEQLLFNDASAWKCIPDMAHHRDQWAFSRTSPHLKPTGRRAIIDFLMEAGERHERALSAHFGSEVTIDKFDPSPVKNIEFSVDDPPDMSQMSDYSGFSSHREGNIVRMTLWR